MFSPLDNTHGRALNYYGQYSEGEAQVFRQLLRPGDVVVDAGANVGMFSVFMAQLVSPRGQVLYLTLVRLFVVCFGDVFAAVSQRETGATLTDVCDRVRGGG